VEPLPAVKDPIPGAAPENLHSSPERS
jgi:hypothetical protein